MSDKNKKLIAPVGLFRVLVFDLFDHTDWVEGDFDSLDEATKVANGLASDLLKIYIYNDRGEIIFESQ